MPGVTRVDADAKPNGYAEPCVAFTQPDAPHSVHTFRQAVAAAFRDADAGG